MTDNRSEPGSGHTVSVILCAYTEERWEDLLAAVESVQKQTHLPLEIILVIDHNPALYQRVSAALPGVRVLENQEAAGLSGARNTGAAAAQGRLVAFMDEDAVADPDWLERLVGGYEAESVAGTGGLIEPWWESARPAWFPEEFDWVVGCTYRGMPEKPATVRNLIGANMSFRRKALRAVGGFRKEIGRNQQLPAGCEETELCIRLRQRRPGSRLVYLPQARVRHRVPASRAQWRYFAARCYAEGLSKAKVAQFVGVKDGLASERSYTLRTLPKGFLRGLADGFRERELGGFLRSLAILAGLGLTLAGYVAGLLSGSWARPRDPVLHLDDKNRLSTLRGPAQGEADGLER